MAEIIPTLNQATLSRMMAGERRLAYCLKKLLEDDYLCWYDIPVGNKRRYPDFIILHPGRGLLFLEVKDWKPDTLQSIDKRDAKLLTHKGLIHELNPLEQARRYSYLVTDILSRDPALQQDGHYQGKLLMPYGWGAVFTNISRRQIEDAIPDAMRELVLPDHLVIYKGEFSEQGDAEAFQQRLWGMFNYQFGQKLTVPQIHRIRWHLFPELRIEQATLFAEEQDEDAELSASLPDMIRIMDIQQEQLARSLGDGHRVIHGVAGSGKTLILGYRCQQLAELSSKPILVLCYNISLAARLRAFISAKGIHGQVQVYHFHDWCAEQLKTYHVRLIDSADARWERSVKSVIAAVEKEQIPRAQYAAVLIDEGHDFEKEWLQLIVQMIDPQSNSLLFLYDDAQPIYKKNAGLGFSLASVGIQAQGRTTVLRLNYRNTPEILRFAYEFARRYIDFAHGDDETAPIAPEAAGAHGAVPEVRRCDSFDGEMRYARSCLERWHGQGLPWGDMALLCSRRHQGRRLAGHLKAAGIPHLWMENKRSKAAYNPAQDSVTVLTVHSSKGLEFPHVIVTGVGELAHDTEQLERDARLLYVGMTRAQSRLLLTTSRDNPFTHALSEIADATA